MDAEQKDDKPGLPAWANFALLSSVCVVIGFLSSCIYVVSVEGAFEFPVTDYLDLID